MERFGISQPVSRREDARLLKGQGLFVDDHQADGAVYGVVVRSRIGHARIDSLDITDASAMPGVLAAITGEDLARDRIGALPYGVAPSGDVAFVDHRQPVLARGIARYVGDGLAFVVAETLSQAQDAGDLVLADLSPLPVVTDCAEAIRGAAPLVWDDAANNTSYVWQNGDKAAVDAAFDAAARSVAIDVVNNRVILNAVETRGALAHYDAAAEKFTLITGAQMPNGIKNSLVSEVLHVSPEQVRVVVDDVGGGFGGKNATYPEYVLCLYAARALGRPIRWTADRGEAFISDYQGRDNITRGELALDAEGNILALRVDTVANLGAYIAGGGVVSTISGTVMLSNTYRIPAIHVQVHGVYTNTVPTAPYRGAGRPEAIYLVERLMDAAARDLGIDRVAFRRQNLIPLDAFPYPTPGGLVYDAADVARLMTAALEKTGWADIEARKAEARQRGRLRGIGMSNYIERCGGGGGLSEAARLACSEDGVVTVYSGSMSNGQGHETAFSQIVHDKLGLSFDSIVIVQGDTDQVETGLGTGGSWSVPMGGGAIAMAADALIEKSKHVAAGQLEAALADVEFSDGHFRVVGTDLSLGFAEAAAGLDGAARFTPDNHTFPYGCHICEVDVDPETGQVEIVAYCAVHDFGRALNPLLLAGQVHGGLVQGMGQAVFEHTVYDADGQLLTGSYMDYCLPRAGDVPFIDFENVVTPSERNPLGIKGCGEAGATGSPPALINAIVDALAPYGVRHIDMPATAERVWRAIRDAEGARSR